MEISENLECLFSTRLEQRKDKYVIEVPRQEIQRGRVRKNGTYQIVIIGEPPEESTGDTEKADTVSKQDDPPVEKGEQLTVEITDIGTHGDGIALIEDGYVVIVRGAEVGEKVRLIITEARPNYAFGNITERIDRVIK